MTPALYLYAVVDRDAAGPLPASGIDGAPIFAVPCHRIAAAVSEIQQRTIRPERRHLAAHDAVLRYLLTVRTPLPVSFGTIAADQAELEKALCSHHADLHSELERLSGCIQTNLRVSFEDGTLTDHLVAGNPRLRATRDTLYRAGRVPSRDEKIALGSMFEQVLEEFRRSHVARVETLLAPHCRELRFNRPRTEREILNLSCLLDRGREAEFATLAEDVGRLFDERYLVALAGAFPPHDFVRVKVALSDGEEDS